MRNLKEQIDYVIKQSNHKILLWLRVDDVGIYTEKFKKLCRLIKKYNLATIFAVIPSKLEKETVIALGELNSYVISQHGFSHENYSSVEYQCELSDTRNVKDVLTEMQLGKDILQKTFHSKYKNILTPPFNKIDDNCAKVLKSYYDIISIFGNSKTDFAHDLNPNVDIVNWHENRCGNKEFVLQQILKSVTNYNHIGICIHSEYLNRYTFKMIENIFTWLVKKDNIISNFNHLGYL